MDDGITRSYSNSDENFTRKRKLPFWKVAIRILSGSKMSIQNGMNRFFSKLGQIDDIPTASAFFQARKKLKPGFFKFVNNFMTDYFYENYDDEYLVKKWKGMYLLAVDCSNITFPDSDETKERYAIQKDDKGNLVCVYGLCSCLYDVLNEIPINVELDNNLREKDYIFENHYRYYKANQLFIYDRLYDDYSVIAFHKKINKDFLIRARINNTFKAVQMFIDSNKTDEIITLKVTDKQKRFVKENNLPEEVEVRVLKIELDNGLIEILITSLLDKEKYPLEDFKWLYNKRWGIETYFDRLKNKLEIERFSSGKVLSIEQDFYGLVFLSTLESILSKEADEEIRKDSRKKNLKYEYKVNKSVSYSTLLDNVVDILTDVNKSSKEIVEELNVLFKMNPTPERLGRKYERKNRSPSKKLRYHKYHKRIMA